MGVIIAATVIDPYEWSMSSLPGRAPGLPHVLFHLVHTTAGEVASIISSHFISEESETQEAK